MSFSAEILGALFFQLGVVCFILFLLNFNFSSMHKKQQKQKYKPRKKTRLIESPQIRCCFFFIESKLYHLECIWLKVIENLAYSGLNNKKYCFSLTYEVKYSGRVAVDLVWSVSQKGHHGTGELPSPFCQLRNQIHSKTG